MGSAELLEGSSDVFMEGEGSTVQILLVACHGGDNGCGEHGACPRCRRLLRVDGVVALRLLAHLHANLLLDKGRECVEHAV